MKSLKISNAVCKKAIAVMVGISLITPYNAKAFMGTGEVVFDPTTYASILESIEKYNAMIKTAQDSLDTLNRVNDIMNTASNQLNNLQTGLADPRQLVSRFESNIKAIEDNAKRIAKNLEEKDWANAFHKFEYASCKKKWQNLLKEYKEWEEQTAKENLDNAIKSGDGSEESEQEISEAKQKYAKTQQANEIERGFKYIDIVETQGLEAATNQMHEWANEAQKYIDVRNSKYISIEEAMRPKDRYTYQNKLCNMVDKEIAKLREKEGIHCYNKAVANKDRKEAEKCIQEIKKARELTYNLNKAPYTEIKNRASAFNIYNNIDNTKPTLDINENNGELTPQDEWNKIEYTTKESAAILEKIPQKDKDGNNTAPLEKWVAKQETIRDLFQRGRIIDALNLQNKRNMLLALQGDSQAIEKSQLETLQMLGMQIQKMHESINIIGQIAEKFLNDDYEREQKNEKEDQKYNTRDELKNFSVDDEVKHWEYNEYGIPVFKNRNFEDKGILGL